MNIFVFMTITRNLETRWDVSSCLLPFSWWSPARRWSLSCWHSLLTSAELRMLPATQLQAPIHLLKTARVLHVAQQL